MSETYKQKPGAAEALARDLRGLRRNLNGLSPEASQRLLALAPRVETSDEAKASAFAARIATLESASELDVEASTELLEELAEVMNYSAGQRLAYRTADYQRFATMLLDRADEAKRPLTGCALAAAARGLIDANAVDTLRRDLGRRFVVSVVKPENLVEAKYFGADEAGRANTEWSSSDEPLIRLTFEVPEADRAQWSTGGFSLTTPDGTKLSQVDESGAVVFTISPKEGFVQGTGRRVAVKVPLVLRDLKDEIARVETTVAPRAAPFFDLKGPSFAANTPALRGETVVVKLSDDGELANELPTARVGGVELVGRRTGEGEFSFALDKGLLKANVDRGARLEVRAVDGFGNPSVNQTLSFDQIRRTVVRAEGERLRTEVQRGLDAVSVSGAGADVTKLATVIAELQPRIEEMRKLDGGAAQPATTALLNTLETKVRTWIGNQPRGKSLADKRADFRRVVDQGAATARSLGKANWSAQSNLDALFNDRAPRDRRGWGERWQHREFRGRRRTGATPGTTATPRGPRGTIGRRVARIPPARPTSLCR